MTGSAFCFVLLGVGVVSAKLMEIVTWLDTPQPRRRRGRRVYAR